MDSEAVKDRAVESSKRPGEELESNKSKKQKLDENVQARVADDDTAELKRCMEIVPKDDDEVTIEATPLSSKSPTIEEERGELPIEEKSKLFVELMNKRKKHFEMLRAEERRRNPPTKAQKRKQMSKDRAVERSKIPREELKSDKSKKQKLDENVQAKVADDDTTKLKRCLEIVPEDDDDVTTKATPLSSKSPTIVDYKI
nr:hypothetical protein [Tanacetum cinerariifolium]